MSRPGEPPEQQKAPLGTRIGLRLLSSVFGFADRAGKKRRNKKRPTVISFGFGGPLVAREICPEERRFTFCILSAASVEGRGTAVSGFWPQGEVHAGDTVTCVAADGRRFPCVIREIEPAAPPNTAPGGHSSKAPPFCTLFVSGHGPEEFHPQDKFIIEAGEHDEQCL